jgi:formate hydrogenlyase subunit 6/NADH:ubiquinone oxidoreductase subunit I
MKKPKLRELKEAVKSLFSPSFTTKFPYQPHTPAKRFRGRPKFFEEHCIGCTACAQVCPADAIDVNDVVEGKKGTRTLVHNPDKCIFCGQCELNCPTKKGIQLTQEFDIAYFKLEEVLNSVEHELVICAHCGEIIGARKHIDWVLKKLGNKAFSQPILITQLMEDMEIPSEYEEKADHPTERTDITKIICPKCRRIAFLKDEETK